MKLNRPFLAIAVMTACVMSAGSAFAGSGCPDDPERCVERGATVSHRTVVVAPATATANAHAAVVATPAHKAPAIAAPKGKPAVKSARVSPATPAPATPGMGMLLKLSNGSGGEVSLFPNKVNDTTTSGASWVL